jgi:hypothetical protein
VGSGELINPTAVYSTVEQGRLAQAKQSDKTVFIFAEEVAVSSKNAATTTKRGIIKSRILVIFSSASFILDAAKINSPSGKIISNFGLSSSNAAAWGRSTEYKSFDRKLF